MRLGARTPEEIKSQLAARGSIEEIVPNCISATGTCVCQKCRADRFASTDLAFNSAHDPSP